MMSSSSLSGGLVPVKTRTRRLVLAAVWQAVGKSVNCAVCFPIHKQTQHHIKSETCCLIELYDVYGVVCDCVLGNMYIIHMSVCVCVCVCVCIYIYIYIYIYMINSNTRWITLKPQWSGQYNYYNATVLLSFNLIKAVVNTTYGKWHSNLPVCLIQISACCDQGLYFLCPMPCPFLYTPRSETTCEWPLLSWVFCPQEDCPWYWPVCPSAALIVGTKSEVQLHQPVVESPCLILDWSDNVRVHFWSAAVLQKGLSPWRMNIDCIWEQNDDSIRVKEGGTERKLEAFVVDGVKTWLVCLHDGRRDEQDSSTHLGRWTLDSTLVGITYE
jgi:hypothetical protein